MDDFTLTVTIVSSVCIIIFGIAAVAGSLLGIFVWYPRYKQKKIEALKSSGRKSEGTIIRLPSHKLEAGYRASVYKTVKIGLEIRVPGIETYEVDKVFTFPSHALDRLEVGKAVTIWIDPNEPRNHDKIVIDIK